MMCLRVTCDLNVLVDLENETGEYRASRTLLACNDTGNVKLCIPAMAASEYRVPLFTNYLQFTAYMEALGITNYEELTPLLHIGMSFLGHAMIAGEAHKQLDRRIQYEVIADDRHRGIWPPPYIGVALAAMIGQFRTAVGEINRL